MTSLLETVPDKEWYTTGEVANELHYTPGWIWILISRGVIKAERSNTAKQAHFRIQRKELLRLKKLGNLQLDPELTNYKALPITLSEEERHKLMHESSGPEAEEAFSQPEQPEVQEAEEMATKDKDEKNKKETDKKEDEKSSSKKPSRPIFSWRIFGG